MNALEFSPIDLRIIALAKKICNTYSVPELDKLSVISAQTLTRWADEKHRPSKLASSALPQILAVSEQAYKDYLEGKITIEDIWEQRGSAKRITPKQAITLQSVLNDAKMLNTMERLKLMSSLFLTLAPADLHELNGLTHDDVNQDPPVFFDLTDSQKKRLKTLLQLSNIYKQQTPQYLIEHGVNKQFIEDVVTNYERDYTKAIYSELLPYLCLNTEWNGETPSNVIPTESFDNVDDLLSSLTST